MNNLKNKLSVRLGILSLIFLAAAISIPIYQYTAAEQSKDTLNRMNQPDGQAGSSSDPSAAGAEPVDVSSGESRADNSSNEETASEENIPLVDNPYAESFLANEDMGAWLKIEGTVIDYPVMWTPREETYYLYRNFEGKEDQNGCLMLDTDSCLDPLTTNLIIHGHNMRSGAMFGNLMKYENEAYCKEHSSITLYTRDRERRYEVIAVFRSQVYKKTDQVFKFYKFFQADTQEEFDDFYENIKALSLYNTGVTASFGDHFITLSTCAYHTEHGRFVVVAKEVESGDRYAPLTEQQGDNNQ